MGKEGILLIPEKATSKQSHRAVPIPSVTQRALSRSPDPVAGSRFSNRAAVVPLMQLQQAFGNRGTLQVLQGIQRKKVIQRNKGTLEALGKAFKKGRERSEQFCVFSFDTESIFEPDVEGWSKDDLRGNLGNYDIDEEVREQTWQAAYFNETGPQHTEKAILAIFDDWLSAYSSNHGFPSKIYIYSFLIPCRRDGPNGMCLDAIMGKLEKLDDLLGLMSKDAGADIKIDVYIGWSNGDFDVDARDATVDELFDANPFEGGFKRITVHTYPNCSIA